MEVQNVELGTLTVHLFHHNEVKRGRVEGRRIQPKCTWPKGHKVSGSAGISTGEQRHVVSEPHQLLRQVGHYTLGSAIEFWRHSFDQRCNLSYSHGPSFDSHARQA